MILEVKRRCDSISRVRAATSLARSSDSSNEAMRGERTFATTPTTVFSVAAAGPSATVASSTPSSSPS
jgi:hypothetical protein